VPRFAPALGVLLALVAAGVAAQEPRSAAAGECPDGRISYVLLDNNSIFDTSDPELDARFLWAYRAANALHLRTRPWVIRRELLFRSGDCFDPFLLAESERLLRAYPFLARVDIHALPQADGSRHVIVDTHDDWSTRVDVRLRVDRELRFEGIRLSELNFLGMGQAVGVFFYERDVTRDYGLTYWTPQIGRTRWDLAASVGHTRAGDFVRQQVGYPFVGEIGLWAGRQSFDYDEQYFDYIVEDDEQNLSPHGLLPLRERLLETSILRRFGERGRTRLLGLGLSYHQLRHFGPVEIAPEGDFDNRVPADSVTARLIQAQMTEREAARVHALLGLRSVRWVERQGFDSMRSDEDIRLGFEAGVALGRSITALGDNDMTLATLLYGAFQARSALVIARARTDALRALGTTGSLPRWQDVNADGELFAYVRGAGWQHHTLLVRMAAAGAWNTVTPFQLTLGGERGVRGYDLERYPGGRRVVFTLEDRIYTGWPLRDVMDAGFTLFADAGRIWPGDAPFGLDSSWRASAGAGLRIGFPADSRTTFRLDFAWPIERGARLGDFQIRMSAGELIGIGSANGDLQFRRSRQEGVAADLFRFARPGS
jgi:hypothetical protein